jgi:hypothetical protein
VLGCPLYRAAVIARTHAQSCLHTAYFHGVTTAAACMCVLVAAGSIRRAMAKGRVCCATVVAQNVHFTKCPWYTLWVCGILQQAPKYGALSDHPIEPFPSVAALVTRSLQQALLAASAVMAPGSINSWHCGQAMTSLVWGAVWCVTLGWYREGFSKHRLPRLDSPAVHRMQQYGGRMSFSNMSRSAAV